jgi:hypothetical protein
VQLPQSYYGNKVEAKKFLNLRPQPAHFWFGTHDLIWFRTGDTEPDEMFTFAE